MACRIRYVRAKIYNGHRIYAMCPAAASSDVSYRYNLEMVDFINLYENVIYKPSLIASADPCAMEKKGKFIYYSSRSENYASSTRTVRSPSALFRIRG